MKANLQTKSRCADIETVPGAPCQSCDLDLELSGLSRQADTGPVWHSLTLCVVSPPTLWGRVISPAENIQKLFRKYPGPCSWWWMALWVFTDHNSRGLGINLTLPLDNWAPRHPPTRDTCHMSHGRLMTQSCVLSPRLMSSSHNLRSPYHYWHTT